jgi:hypothetical protein
VVILINDEKVIKGRRMIDLESKIFHGWQDLNLISIEELNRIIDKLNEVPMINPIPLDELKKLL